MVDAAVGAAFVFDGAMAVGAADDILSVAAVGSAVGTAFCLELLIFVLHFLLVILLLLLVLNL